ncbi:MAG TPA: TIGR00303 family protein [Nitrosopumilaceae archaeon]|nr:TIGR00303 family protein [Nitrosopumilaceae archaeon]
MDDITILGNSEKGKDFIKKIEKNDFLFSFVISYTETCEIPGITIAGADQEAIKYTPAADAEFLHYGFCKSIDKIPMTPDGKPTPAILTKVALESASIPHVIVDAGSKIKPKLPFFHLDMESGKNISEHSALDSSSVTKAVDYGRILGRTLASLTNCLLIGESIPGGTTTALAVMRKFGIDAKVSSSIPKNPVELKNKIVEDAAKRFDSDNPYTIVSNLGDPMIPIVAGMLSSASEITNVILCGGTQMAAVLAFAKKIGFNENNTAVGTTCYITNDKTSNFLEIISQIVDIPVLVIDPKLEKSKFEGIKAFSQGFAKEGVGAGGCMIASILKTGTNSEKLLELIEKEYQRVFT